MREFLRHIFCFKPSVEREIDDLARKLVDYAKANGLSQREDFKETVVETAQAGELAIAIYSLKTELIELSLQMPSEVFTDIETQQAIERLVQQHSKEILRLFGDLGDLDPENRQDPE